MFNTLFETKMRCLNIACNLKVTMLKWISLAKNKCATKHVLENACLVNQKRYLRNEIKLYT